MTRAFFGIAAFELRYYLVRISTWVYFATFFAIAFLLLLAIGGAFPGVNMAVAGSGGNVYVNAPRSLVAQVMMVSLFGIMVTAALLGNATYRDFETRIHPLFFTAPIRRVDYLGGRFVGALIANAVVFLSIPLGLIAASLTPFMDTERLGPIRLAAYFHPYLVGVLPNLLLTGAVFFVLAALTRQMLANYVGGVLLLVGYLIANNSPDLDDQVFAALVDPFGLTAMGHVTRYWTAAEQNTLLLPMEGVMLWNRLLWIGVALTILGVAIRRFRFVHTVDERRRTKQLEEPAEGVAPAALVVPAARQRFDRSSRWAQYAAVVRSSFRGIILNRYFAAILGAAIIFLVFAAGQVGTLYGTTTWPVTYEVLELLGGMFALFVLIIVTFYGGELVWRERDTGMDQVVDATPAPTWVFYGAKLTALLGIVVILQAVLMVAGIVTQAAKGYYDFEIGQYLTTLFGFSLLDYALLCVLIMLIHVLVNNKYAGHLIAVLYFVAVLFASQLGVEHNLLLFGSHSGFVYSDMNGYGPFVEPLLWFQGFWAVWALILALASNLFWVRGREVRPRWRLRLAKLRLTRPVVSSAVLAAILVMALGGFIYYNTNILNDFTTTLDGERERAEYERLYKQFEGAPQPRIASISVQVDLYPETRDYTARGEYLLENRTDIAIDSLHLIVDPDLEVDLLDFGRQAEAVLADQDRGFYIHRLTEPIAPGEQLTLRFALRFETRGFENNVSNLRIVENGTFLASDVMPQLGYRPEFELQDDEIRRKHGLPPRPGMPPADDLEARKNNPLVGDADWIDFQAVVSTAEDQIAIAPGYLQREWVENGRRHFHYVMDSPMLAFYSVLSARYEVRRDRWNDVAIEIFYHPTHDYNVDRMIDAVKKSLEYYEAEFGPYQHRQVRILEFPRYQQFAQSFPNTIPYSESIGFIARIEDPAIDIDYVFYVTAHEVAHQWWGHQTVGGAVQGSTFLIETLSQYSALMVMEKEYGAEQMRRFLRYELERYLTGRAFERRKELPLLQVENQAYIHYNKGSLVMYALRDYIGEERLNQALRGFLEETRFQEPPYTSATELYAHFREVTPDSLHYFLRDMFEEITLYENRVRRATSEQLPDGRFKVTLEVEAQKLRADSIGNEERVPMNDLIDIGIFAPAPRGQREGELIYLAKHRIREGVQTVEVTVDSTPGRAGIDPQYKLVDRQLSDNVTDVAVSR